MTDRSPAESASLHLAEAEAMLARLPAYLASDALFQSVTVEHHGHTHHATLTLGNLLERLDEVRRASFAEPDEARRAGEADALHDQLRAAHRAAYSDKLAKELRSHENAMRSEREDAADEGGAAPGHESAAQRHQAAIRRLRGAG